MATRSTELGFVTKTLRLTRKDLRIEARGRDTLVPMISFALAVVLLLSFTLPDDAALTEARAAVLAGFVWVTVLFAGLIGFARTFEVEREDGALDALLLVPLDRSGLFFAKALANLAFIGIVEAILLPMVAVFFSLSLGTSWLTFLLVVALVDLGFVALGTLFASVAAHTRSRELILPILALPALVPVFIAAVELTADLFAGGALDDVAARGWFGILIAFDVLAITAGALTFEFAVD